MILPDPFCEACGRLEALAECLLPRAAVPAARRAAGALVRLNLCAPCVQGLGVLPSTPFAPVTPITARRPT